jgi:hypothetical protein
MQLDVTKQNIASILHLLTWLALSSFLCHPLKKKKKKKNKLKKVIVVGGKRMW